MRPLPLLLTLAIASMAGASYGAEPAPQTTPVDEPAAPAPVKDAAKDQDKSAAATPDKHAADASKAAKGAADKSSDKSAADKAAAEKNSPQRFVPTEQVRADFDVSFPVDM